MLPPKSIRSRSSARTAHTSGRRLHFLRQPRRFIAAAGLTPRRAQLTSSRPCLVVLVIQTPNAAEESAIRHAKRCAAVSRSTRRPQVQATRSHFVTTNPKGGGRGRPPLHDRSKKQENYD